MKKRIVFLPALLFGISGLLSLSSCGGADSRKAELASETEQSLSDTSALTSDTTASTIDTVPLAPQTEQATVATPKSAPKTTDKPVESAKAKPAASSSSEGKALMAKSDCFACHKTDTKLVGPAYEEVAQKYPDTEETFSKLAEKIINGGAGVWGEVPMSPHPQISSSEAKKMAQYILSLK
jgi:cytochrome c